MEEVIDFDQWLESQKSQPVKFYFIYDGETGVITGLYPESAAVNIENKLLITDEMHKNLLSGEDKIDDNRINVLTKTLVPKEKVIIRENSSLHRVAEVQYQDSLDLEIYLRHSISKSSITVELSKTDKKNLQFNKEFELVFYFTDYNDPHILHNQLVVKLADLIDNNSSYKITDLPNKYSVFTNNVFFTYGIEFDENF